MTGQYPQESSLPSDHRQKVTALNVSHTTVNSLPSSFKKKDGVIATERVQVVRSQRRAKSTLSNNSQSQLKIQKADASQKLSQNFKNNTGLVG